MGYLLTEIVVYLVIAGLIGFAFGWAVKAYSSTFTTTKKVLKEEENEVVPKTEEPIKVEEETVDAMVEINKPTLLTQSPEKGADTLSALKGIGPVLEKKLNELGIYTYEQIASWTTEQEIWVGTQISFPKTVIKEKWVKQARELLEAK